MRLRFLPASLMVVSILVACTPFTKPSSTDQETLSSSSSADNTEMPVTRNVTYIGTLDQANPSIYQQGTHTLTLSDGQFLLIESSDVGLNLDSYVGKRIEARGSVRPTVEGSGTIMSVEEIMILGEESSSAAETSSASPARKMCGGIAAFPCDEGYVCVDNPDDSCDPERGGADCGGICVKSVASSSSSTSVSSAKPAMSSSAPASRTSSSSPTVMSSSASVTTGLEAQIVLMSKQKYDDPSLWTQTYCTTHIGYCVRAHKNWYFKSFGATTSNSWHVEFGMQEIAALYDGPIVMNLVEGSSASMDARDGEVRSQGSDVIGFKDWSGKHFEIIADARLKAAVTYMVSHISSYAVSE
jgi:hypothetical protein